MLVSSLYLTLLATSTSFVMSAPADNDYATVTIPAPEPTLRNRDFITKRDAFAARATKRPITKRGGTKPSGSTKPGNTKPGNTKPGSTTGKCRRGTKTTSRDLLLEARFGMPTFLGGGTAAGTFCGIKEAKNSRPKDCSAHKFTADTGTAKRAITKGSETSSAYTPLSKSLGTSQIKRLEKELSGLKRKASAPGKNDVCDYPIEIQVMDLVLYQNEVCQALDGLAGIIETTAAKKNALKLEWMTEAIKVATSANTNMWEVPKGVYGAKKAVTAAVLKGQTGVDEKEAENLQAYLGEAQASVDVAAKAMSDKVWAGLLKAAKDAKLCAKGAAEKKKITAVMANMKKAHTKIAQGLKKYYADTVEAVGSVDRADASGTGDDGTADSSGLEDGDIADEDTDDTDDGGGAEDTEMDGGDGQSEDNTGAEGGDEGTDEGGEADEFDVNEDTEAGDDSAEMAGDDGLSEAGDVEADDEGDKGHDGDEEVIDDDEAGGDADLSSDDDDEEEPVDDEGDSEDEEGTDETEEEEYNGGLVSR